MPPNLLFESIDTRVTHDMQEGDSTYFFALSLKLEYIMKIVISGVIACIDNDPNRHRYSLEYDLVRADSLGKWVKSLETALTGPSAQLFGDGPQKQNLIRDLTQRVSRGDWRHDAVSNLAEAARAIGADVQLSNKVMLREFFSIGSQLRNRSRGHGAPTSEQCGHSCKNLGSALEIVTNKLCIFRLPWAYVKQNLSGKYRVIPLLNDASPFDVLKKKQSLQLQEKLPDGVYLYLDRLIHNPLVFYDPDINDVLLPNGNYKKDKSFETLSYITNRSKFLDETPWARPTRFLPSSETEGKKALEPFGKTFANVPPMPSSYVARKDLEERIRRELLKSDRHPIISLTGSGGIGKTTVAIAAIHDVKNSVPYDVILWISARDIDLLNSGPKPVSPQVVTIGDIAHAAFRLLEPNMSDELSYDAWFQECMEKGAAGPTLFVFDNFETMQNPSDTFTWIDTYIRSPNKVLITTRFRSFVGDYHIEIAGMTDEQAISLVNQHAAYLGISSLLTEEYKEKLIHEADGHPYVMKVLLGQVAKERRAKAPKRIMESSEDILKALFERTYNALSPGAQRVFLLLCSWRVDIPKIAVEAICLRPEIDDRFGVVDALEELRRYSFIEITSDDDSDASVTTPLSAVVFGRRKLEASPLKIQVDQDRLILMEFGAGQGKDLRVRILSRIDNFVIATAKQASNSPRILWQRLPILEYLAERIPETYLRLADLVLEIEELDNFNRQAKQYELAKQYVRKFIEVTPRENRLSSWRKLADICASSQDLLGEIHALGEVVMEPGLDQEEVGAIASRLNYQLRAQKQEPTEGTQVKEARGIIKKVIQVMERNFDGLSATNCSRLAWLYLNIGNPNRALQVAKCGADKDSTNEHCQRLVQRLNS